MRYAASCSVAGNGDFQNTRTSSATPGSARTGPPFELSLWKPCMRAPSCAGVSSLQLRRRRQCAQLSAVDLADAHHQVVRRGAEVEQRLGFDGAHELDEGLVRAAAVDQRLIHALGDRDGSHQLGETLAEPA